MACGYPQLRHRGHPRPDGDVHDGSSLPGLHLRLRSTGTGREGLTSSRGVGRVLCWCERSQLVSRASVRARVRLSRRAWSVNIRPNIPSLPCRSCLSNSYPSCSGWNVRCTPTKLLTATTVLSPTSSPRYAHSVPPSLSQLAGRFRPSSLDLLALCPSACPTQQTLSDLVPLRILPPLALVAVTGKSHDSNLTSVSRPDHSSYQ